LSNMHDARLDAWIAQSGFSARELAAIQPEYAPHGDGAALYAAGRYEDALRAFERDFELSGRPALLYNIARCLEQLQHFEEAIESYRDFLAAAPDSPHRAQAESRIAGLEDVVRARPSSAPSNAAPATQRGCACAIRPSPRSSEWVFALVAITCISRRRVGRCAR
jgi:tetratricopeptide (TPR) repeat protein